MLFLICLWLAGATASAEVRWQSALPLTGEANVSINGSLERAYHFGPSTPELPAEGATVNGVFFASFGVDATSTQNDVLVDQTRITSQSFLVGSSNYGSTAEPFSTLSPAYQALLGSGVYSVFSPLTVYLLGLTPGQAYEVQFFVNDSRGTNRQETFDGVGSADFCVPPTDGSLGQSIIGTFLAETDSQVMTVSGIGGPPSRAQLNAF